MLCLFKFMYKKLSIKCQSYPKSRKIDAFKQKKAYFTTLIIDIVYLINSLSKQLVDLIVQLFTYTVAEETKLVLK